MSSALLSVAFLLSVKEVLSDSLVLWFASLQTTDRFLRLSVEIAIERCLGSMDAPQEVAAKVRYLQVDALAQLVAVLLRLGARPAAVCDPRLGCIPGALAAHAGHTALAERLHRSATLQRAASSASFRGAGEALLFARRFPLPAELTLLVLSFCAADWF